MNPTRAIPGEVIPLSPIEKAPLFQFESLRSGLLRDVAASTAKSFEGAPLDLLLGEALFQEKLRLKRNRRPSLSYLMTIHRAWRDARLWKQVHRGLLKPVHKASREELLSKVLSHYLEEIGGHFDPKIYRMATHAVPWFFSWFLNAASVRQFSPWKMTEDLRSRIRIVGEVAALQRLSNRGTILIVPTHQSNVDSLLIGYVIYLMGLPPFSYGAGLNLYSNPVLSFFMSSLGSYTVDRQKTNIIYKTALKNYSARILEAGIHSIFFPGGGRVRSGAIEEKVKLGLLGTALSAQLANLRSGVERSSVFIVPMVTSYHFVLEASSLIEQYLEHLGKHRFIGTVPDESSQVGKILNFFWKLFSSESGITVRIGKPLDVFGNEVDLEGKSIGPNASMIDPAKWLTSRGELTADPQRDHEYTRELGAQIVESFYRNNTVLTSHWVAYAFQKVLRKKYSDLDLFRFLRLSLAQRSIPYAEFVRESESLLQKLRGLAQRGELFLSPELEQLELDKAIEDGIRNLGFLHESSVVAVSDQVVYTEDMNLLYYYSNRLSGYGLTEEFGRIVRIRGEPDDKGFLA